MMMDWERIVYELWKILDDIDTASDMVKGNDKAYREIVEKLQRKRWEILNEVVVDDLYNQYHSKESTD